MKYNKFTRKRGLSQVVVTLIILAVSVLMASGTLTYYSMAVTTSSMRMEQLVIREARIWANETGSQAAVHVENIGGRDALITSIEVRYIEEEWSEIYYTSGGGGTLTPTQRLNITGSFTHTVGDEDLNFAQSSGSLLLPVSGSLIIYIDQPDSIAVSDIGAVVHIYVCSSTLQYIAVVNVETA